MDDPIFEPWGDAPESATPATPSQKRWRAPEEPPAPPRSDARPGAAEPIAPTTSMASMGPIAPIGATPTTQRVSVTPRARLAGTPGFVRTMVVPRLADIATRLQLARHEAVTEDLLDHTPPVVRLTFRPWRGPWTEKLDPPRSVLELTVESDAEEQIALGVFLDGRGEDPTWRSRISPTKLSAVWLEGQVVDFVERALERL